MSERPRCLVIDGHPLVRLGVRGLLSDDFELEEAANHHEGVDLVRDVGDFDVAILEMRPVVNGRDRPLTGAEAISLFHRTEPALGIVAHGDLPQRHLCNAAMQAGATAYVSRNSGAEKLRRAVDAALVHESFIDPAVPPKGSRGVLTRRQRQILQLLADGESTTVAAGALEVSDETVKTHTKHILARLGARNRTQAVAIALRESLIE